MQPVTRRAFLAWLTGTAAALVVAPAEARPKPKPPLNVYTNVYASTY